MSEQEQKVQQFVELTQVPANVARSLLERNNYEVESALDDFYQGPTARKDGTSALGREGTSQQHQIPANASSSSTKKPTTSRFKSFRELVNGEDKDDDDEQNFFAGGARGSGLEVENPNNPQNLVQDLLRKAESGGGHPERVNESDDAPSSSSKFHGVGYQLGDTNTPSRQVGSAPSTSRRAEKAVREITFWKDGFQVGDGPLYRYDDPANATYLAELNAGRAPLSLLNVEYGQDVDVNVMRKIDEEYKPPKRKAGGFHGKGNRLGSPVSPDYVSPSTTPTPSSNVEAKEEIRDDKPEEAGDSSVQVRLVDGRRVVKKLNSSDTVESLYLYVKSETDDKNKPFTLNYSFPVRPIEDLKQTIKEAGLVNSVVVQRWV